MFRSLFFPRALGWLVAAAGFAFVINSILLFVTPVLGRAVSSYLVTFDGIGEIVLMLWLLLIGVNDQKWNSAATSTSRRGP
jgi:hypothetical protein